MKWMKLLFVAAGLAVMAGCGDRDPVSSTGGEDGPQPAARTRSNSVAATCERCGPGYRGITITPQTPPPASAIRTKIAILSSRGENQTGTLDLFVMDEDGSNAVALTDSRVPKTLTAQAWSPDGTRLVFSDRRDVPSNQQRPGAVFAINADGTDEQMVVDFAQNASWSADGSTIIADINGEIGATNPDGSDSRILTNRVGRPIMRQGPMPSPDGMSIIFSEYALYLMDIDGSNTRQFGPDGGLSGVTTTFGIGATWSPDGTKIAFHSHLSPAGTPQPGGAGGPVDIFVIDADGQNMVNLTNSATSNDNWPTWSPDGSRIAFVSSRDVPFGSDIYVMDADGSNLVQITDAEGFELYPAWSPR